MPEGLCSEAFEVRSPMAHACPAARIDGNGDDLTRLESAVTMRLLGNAALSAA